MINKVISLDMSDGEGQLVYSSHCLMPTCPSSIERYLKRHLSVFMKRISDGLDTCVSFSVMSPVEVVVEQDLFLDAPFG